MERRTYEGTLKALKNYEAKTQEHESRLKKQQLLFQEQMVLLCLHVRSYNRVILHALNSLHIKEAKKSLQAQLEQSKLDNKERV